ncbi:MAG: hypothetical protein P4N41_13750 [Negativicutes bacterium]|nr:hypothetical protein [Negativicutes bacterium]
MLVTFPHMGTMHIVLRSLLTGFGLKTLAPPLSKKTLEIGAVHAPETACLPFKISLGTFIQALDQGADTILTCGGCGPCRLGYYAEVQKDILRDLGYDFELVVVEPDIASVYAALRQMTPGRSWREIWQAFRLAGAKLTAIDAVDRRACFVRPREAHPGSIDNVRKEALVAIDRAGDPAELARTVRLIEDRISAVAVDPAATPLKIGLVGEIYLLLEPFANQELTGRLGRLGVEVHSPMLLGEYVQTHILKNRQALKVNSAVAALAAPYLGHYVGGHGVKSVGYTVQMGRAGYDGMIHVFPFTCMPEVIAKNILPDVSSAADIPVLSMAFDEQTGMAGVVTRLEAFTDLLRHRRRAGC